jgi:hypothetical protein
VHFTRGEGLRRRQAGDVVSEPHGITLSRRRELQQRTLRLICTPQLQATDQPKNPEPGGVIMRSKTEHGVLVMKMKRQRTREGKGGAAGEEVV